MSAHTSYDSVMARKDDIMRASVGIDYGRYATGRLSFDYEGLLADTGYDLPSIRRIQAQTAVGNTPLVELTNITRLARAIASPGKGARIFVKDEAANPSGSFKDRRASLSVHEAKRRGFGGVAAATSGNYGAAVASQAAKAGLRAVAQAAARELGPKNIHVAHLVIDSGVDTAWVRERIKAREGEEALAKLPPDRLMRPQAVADAYWALHQQPRDAWSSEMEIRPFGEKW